MPKGRSPQYPSISLRDAVRLMNGIYQKQKNNPISRAQAAENMGYTSLNGKSLAALSTLKKFGLLEGRGDDSRVSDLGAQIATAAPSSIERQKALKTAAQCPKLYVQFYDHFGREQIDDDELKDYLNTIGFSPSAADIAIRAYVDTQKFLKDEIRDLDEPTNKTGEVQNFLFTDIFSAPSVKNENEKGAKKPGVRKLSLPVHEGDVELSYPDYLSPESVADIESYLKIFVNKIRREAGFLPETE